MNEMIQVAAFLKRRIPKLRSSYGRRNRENLLMWLAWHTARYNACTVKNGDKIIAVGVARAINDPNEALMPYSSDETGKICYVEHVASISQGGMQTLLEYVKKRWSNCHTIMFRRSKSDSFKLYNINDFMRKAGI